MLGKEHASPSSNQISTRQKELMYARTLQCKKAWIQKASTKASDCEQVGYAL
jgi:hypothetical protein